MDGQCEIIIPSHNRVAEYSKEEWPTYPILYFHAIVNKPSFSFNFILPAVGAGTNM